MSYLLLPRLTTSYPVSPLSTRSYVVSYCQPALSYLILLHPTSYTVPYCQPNRVLHCFFCESTLYYLILPHLTTSYPVLPVSTPSYVVVYCHPTLDSTPSYRILPHLTTSYPVAPSYPILQCILLPSYLTSNPVISHPTPYNHILPRPTIESFAILPCPT